MLTFISRGTLSRPGAAVVFPVRELLFSGSRAISREVSPVKGDSFTMDHPSGTALYVFPGRGITFPDMADGEGSPGTDYKHLFTLYENRGMD